MKSLSFFKTVFLLVLLMSISSLLSAQPADPPSGGGVPLDGGLSLLIAGGIAYIGNEVKSFLKKKER